MRRVPGLTVDQANRVSFPWQLGRGMASRYRMIADSGGITVAPGTAPTESAWVEAIASTAETANAVRVVIGSIAANAVNSSSLWDVGIGAAASEVVVLADILGYGGSGWNPGTSWKAVTIPVNIPKGSRVAMRATCATASRAGTSAQIQVLSTGTEPAPTLYPLTTVDGTTCLGSITASTTAWSQVTASCPIPLGGVVVMFGFNGNTTVTGGSGLVDIGVGASGSETVFGRLPYMLNSSELLGYESVPMWGYIPAGTRIAVRKTTSANTIDCHILGIPYA